MANGSYGVVIDNISGIAKWWSDSLCKSATGDGWVRRKLYTDGELAVTSFRRVVILTSIDAGSLRGDLGDRLLLCELERIPDSKRLSERQLLIEFARQAPAILGALLDLVSAVLRELPQVTLAAGPRMMDFGMVLAAIDRVRGTRSLDLYFAQRDSIAADVVDADPVAKALVDFMDGRPEWTGIATELLVAVTPDDPPRDWPKSPRGLTARLKHAAPALRRLNIEIIRPDRDSTRKRDRRVIVRRLCQETVQTVRTSEDSSERGDGDGRHRERADANGSDGSDGCSGNIWAVMIPTGWKSRPGWKWSGKQKKASASLDSISVWRYRLGHGENEHETGDPTQVHGKQALNQAFVRGRESALLGGPRGNPRYDGPVPEHGGEDLPGFGA